ncbi:TPM domain-containing protein [Anaerolentibacter hominis]|uniref:TPM domain-containing protein n=1 Tax=Anaerolentibacter hominis TaxID=3079009 RepID=UPI0031B871A9
MKSRYITSALVLFLLVALMVLSPKTANAYDPSIRHVYDDAGLLTEQEINLIEEAAVKYGAKRNINFFVLTTLDTGNDTEGYSESFYGDFINEHGETEKDCVILTIDMGFRYADVSGQGTAKTKLDNDRCTKIFDKLSSDLSRQDYYGACMTYLKLANRYLQFRPGVNPDLIFFRTWFQVFAALLVGGISLACMVSGRGGRMTAGQSTYLDPAHSRLTGQRDTYLRTTTTRTRKASSSSSGGSSGRSSGGGGGGGSHGGGHF